MLMSAVCFRDKPAVIANMSARVGSIGDNQLGGWYSYRASKTALNQLTKTMAIECSRRKTNVSCIMLHPGTVDTDLSAPFQKVGLSHMFCCCFHAWQSGFYNSSIDKFLDILALASLLLYEIVFLRTVFPYNCPFI